MAAWMGGCLQKSISAPYGMHATQTRGSNGARGERLAGAKRKTREWSGDNPACEPRGDVHTNRVYCNDSAARWASTFAAAEPNTEARCVLGRLRKAPQGCRRTRR